MNTDQRLQRLERQNAKMKAAVAGMAVVLAVVLLVGAGQEKDKPKVLEEVRVKKFVVVDQKGEVRGRFSAEDLHPVLVFGDIDEPDGCITAVGPGWLRTACRWGRQDRKYESAVKKEIVYSTN